MLYFVVRGAMHSPIQQYSSSYAVQSMHNMHHYNTTKPSHDIHAREASQKLTSTHAILLPLPPAQTGGSTEVWSKRDTRVAARASTGCNKYLAPSPHTRNRATLNMRRRQGGARLIELPTDMPRFVVGGRACTAVFSSTAVILPHNC
jgi:hypothetical protein